MDGDVTPSHLINQEEVEAETLQCPHSHQVETSKTWDHLDNAIFEDDLFRTLVEGDCDDEAGDYTLSFPPSDE